MLRYREKGSEKGAERECVHACEAKLKEKGIRHSCLVVIDSGLFFFFLSLSSPLREQSRFSGKKTRCMRNASVWWSLIRHDVI